MTWIVSADIGQAHDPTAIVALETSESTLDLRHLERLPLGTPYPAVVGRLIKLADMLPAPCDLVIDGTGVGRPVFDMLRHAGKAPIAISITGKGEAQLAEDGFWRVPKSELVRALLTAVETGRLRIAAGLAHGNVLTRELAAFQARISDSGHASFEGNREHDDLVMALAMGVWWHMTARSRDRAKWLAQARVEAEAMGERLGRAALNFFCQASPTSS